MPGFVQSWVKNKRLNIIWGGFVAYGMNADNQAVTGYRNADSKCDCGTEGKHHLPGCTGERNAAREVITAEAPAYWASYLINNDDSGLSADEKRDANEWLQMNKLPFPLSCEPAGIGQFDGIMCDLETYSFLI